MADHGCDLWCEWSWLILIELESIELNCVCCNADCGCLLWLLGLIVYNIYVSYMVYSLYRLRWCVVVTYPHARDRYRPWFSDVENNVLKWCDRSHANNMKPVCRSMKRNPSGEVFRSHALWCQYRWGFYKNTLKSLLYLLLYFIPRTLTDL